MGRVVVLGSLNVDVVTRVESHLASGRPFSVRRQADSPVARAATRRWPRAEPVPRSSWSDGSEPTTRAPLPRAAHRRHPHRGADVRRRPDRHRVHHRRRGGENTIVVVRAPIGRSRPRRSRRPASAPVTCSSARSRCPRTWSPAPPAWPIVRCRIVINLAPTSLPHDVIAMRGPGHRQRVGDAPARRLRPHPDLPARDVRGQPGPGGTGGGERHTAR